MGTVRVTQDVEVTLLDSTEAAVITTQTLPIGERVLLEIPDERNAVSKARLFRTEKTRFVLKDGRLRREVRLSIIGHTGIPDEKHATSEPTRATAAPMIAAISRRVPVRLIEVSASGCLFYAPTPLDEGSVGFIEVRTPGRHRTEAVRVLRTERAGGDWPFRMAVEFLTLAPLSPDSLRGVAAVVATGAPSSAHRP